VRAFVPAVVCVLVLPAGLSVAAQRPSKVVRDASRLSGFALRHPIRTASVSATRYESVVSRAWTREADAPFYKQLGLVRASVPTERPRAWYDVGVQKLFVQRRPAAGRRAVMQEVVRALIDQNYRLKQRLAGLRRRDRDRWLAANAIVDGTAALTSRVRTPIVRGTPLDRFVALERSAGLGPGRTLAARLRYLGGRKALATALRNFPRTTEQLLHVDKFLQRERALPVRLPVEAGGNRLELSETFGELEVRNLLRAFPVPSAAAVATGWGGGRVALYGDAMALVIRWDSPEDAAEWQATVPLYVAAAFPGEAARTCPPLDRCWSGPSELAAGVYGTTAVFISGPHAAEVGATLLAAKLTLK
jgi:hypothetical protein